MIKILTSAQIKGLDKATIEGEPITSIDLMERASLGFVRWFVRKFNQNQKVGVVCGTGNNGGDGLAIARLLRERHHDVTVWVVKGGTSDTNDFKTNLSRLAGTAPLTITKDSDAAVFDSVNILVDAMFGSGLSRPLEGLYAEVVAKVNRARAVRVAVDIPSGLMADTHSVGEIVKADYTVGFQLPKLAFMLPENGVYVGQWEVVDIGLSEKHLAGVASKNGFVTASWAKSQITVRKKFAHKGDFGKALLVAGSLGKMGASVLAARATLRSGAGLLTVHVPACGYEIIQTSVPEAMASVDKNPNYVTSVKDLAKFDCVGIGPGLGTAKSTAKVLEAILKTGKPVVIDADALNILSEHKPLMKLLHEHTILTPHPGEFRRLAGDWKDDFARLELQRKLSAKTGATVVLKGAHTSTAVPDGRMFFNSTGNPGMATGGSGDVLTGMITGLLAQGFEPLTAAILGVYLHGRAGDLAQARSGPHSLIASDIVDMISTSVKSSFL